MAVSLLRTLTFALAACLSIAAGGVDAGGSRAPRRYRVTDLGTLPNCDVTYATAVNDAGWVVGYAYQYAAPGHGSSLLSRPFLWRNGTLTGLTGLGGQYGRALAINRQGDVAGYAETKEY